MPDKTKNYNGELIIGEEIITLQTDLSVGQYDIKVMYMENYLNIMVCV